MSSPIPTKPMELMLAGWRESNSSGFVVSFFVAPEDESYFRNATARKGKIAGQRYQTVFVQLVDGQEVPDPKSVKPMTQEEKSAAMRRAMIEMPVAKNKAHFPLGLCGLAVKWCSDPHFHAWLYDTHPSDVEAPETLTAAWASSRLKQLCQIESRKELDTSPDAAARFRAEIMGPYVLQRQEDGVDD